MELVEGTPLDQVIAAGPLSIETALNYARQIAAALEVAHASGIVHRDIKPANIMVTRDGRIKVLDFGLAKLMERAPADATMTAVATRAGIVMGTAAYMSPEQAEGKPVDARSDVFSFGAVLYEMLAGTPAVHGIVGHRRHHRDPARHAAAPANRAARRSRGAQRDRRSLPGEEARLALRAWRRPCARISTRPPARRRRRREPIWRRPAS